MTSLPRHYKRSVVSNYAAVGVSLLVVLVATPIMARGLGQEAFGVWGLATTAVSYLGLLQIGFGRAAVRHVAAEHERGRLDRLGTVISTSALSLMFPAVVVLLLTPVFALLFPHVFHVSPGLVAPAMAVVALSAVDLAFSIPSDTFGAVLIGLQRYDVLNLTVAGTAFLQAVGWVLIIAFGGGLVPLGICLLGFGLIGQLARFLFAQRLLGPDVVRVRHFRRSMVRPLLTTSGWIAINEVTDTINGQVDAIVVGIVIGVPQAAVYIIGQKLANLASSVTTPVLGMFYPHAARLEAAGDEAGVRASAFSGTRISLGIAIPIMLVLCVTARPALDAWVGPEYASATAVVILLAGAVLVNVAARTVIDVVNGLGHVKTPALFGILEASVNLPLSVALALAIGLEGVALATLLAEVITVFGLKLPYSCKKTGISMWELLWGSIRGHVAPCIVAGAVGVALVRAGVSGLIEVTAIGVIMLAVYALVLSMTGLSSGERSALWRRLHTRSQSG